MDNVDWDQVKTFGEFFRRQKGDMLAGQKLDDDFYGIEYQAGKDYDSEIMQVNGFIWQYGGNIWDETKAPEGQAEGVVNSPEAVKALEHYLSLLQYMPPVAKTATMGISQIDELFRAGKVAYEIEWVGFAESTINPKTSKVADKVAFAQSPGLRDKDGKLVRWNNIGGQPFVLTTWNSDEVDPGSARLLQVVALDRHAEGVRQPRRPECVEERLHACPSTSATGHGTGRGRRAWIGRRTSGTCQISTSCWSTPRRSTARRSRASRMPRRRWITSPSSSRTCSPRMA